MRITFGAVPARRDTNRAAVGRTARLALVATVALALAACVPPAVAPVGNGPLPEGVSVEFVQLRSDVAARQAQVQVRNGTGAPLEVGDVVVADQRFDGDAVRAIEGRSSTVAPGSTVDVRIQLPPMDCDATEGGMHVALTLADGVREAPLPDPLDVVGPLHERECLAERVADAVHLSFATFTPSPAGEPARLGLAMDPTGRGDAIVTGIQTTNLLTFDRGPGATQDSFPIGLRVDEDSSGRVAVDLPLVPLRCDPHAVQEDKRGTIFTIEVEIDGAVGEIELAAPEELRGRLLTWVAQWCGFGS